MSKLLGSLHIVAVLLIIFFALSSFALFLSNALDHINDSLGYVEIESSTLNSALEKAGLEIPQSDSKNTYTYKVFDAYSKHYVDVTNTTVFLDREQTDAFCKSVEGDSKWITELDEGSEDFFATFVVTDPGDVFFVYNLTESTYNSLSATDVECDYLVVVFASQYEYIDIYEFAK